MRILLLAYDYKPNLGGIATATFELAKALAKEDATEVIVLAPRVAGIANDQSDSHGFFKTERVPISKNSFLAVFQYLFHLRRAVVRLHPDVFFTTLWLPGSVVFWLYHLIWSFRKIPYFSLVHGVELLESNSTLKKRLRRRLSWIKERALKRSAAVFSVSRYTTGLLQSECGIAPDRVTTVFNGVDSQVFVPKKEKPPLLKEKYGIQDETVFLTVSRLVDYKGMDRALGAFRNIPKSARFKYLICGEGPDEERLKKLSREYGLSDRTVFVGKVREEDLLSFYHLSDVFILLSRDDRVTPNCEGLGIVLLEASACEKPCLVGASGGMPEVVQDGITGWVVPPENEKSIGEAMLTAIENPNLCKKMGEHARSRVVQKFNWMKISQTVVNEMRKNVRN